MSDQDNMKDENDFFVGYLDMPKKDRRFLLKAVPLGLLGVAGAGLGLGMSAPSKLGGRWETGTPVTLTGRIGFHPYPVLWTGGKAIVLSGVAKKSADAYLRPFEGQVVEISGIKITRKDCFMLGVADGDIKTSSQTAPPLPQTEVIGEVSLMGEILDAQCFMGIMTPGYGRSHRGCATLCIRGGLPVYFSAGVGEHKNANDPTHCGGIGYLLANSNGEKINMEILDHIAVPLTITARHEKIGSHERLVYKSGSLKRLI